MNILSGGHWKPPLGSHIDFSHPLARGMAGCFLLNGGRPFNLARSLPVTAVNAVVDVPGGVKFNSGGYIQTGITDTFLDFSIVVAFRDTGSPATFERIADKAFDTGFFLGRDSNTASLWGGWVRGGPGDIASVTLSDGGRHQLAMVRNAAGAVIDVYGDGTAVTDSQAGINVGAMSTVNLTLGASSDLADSYQGEMYYAYVWNRRLTPTELAWLYIEPYTFVQLPTPARSYFIPVTVGGSFQPVWAAQSNIVIQNYA